MERIETERRAAGRTGDALTVIIDLAALADASPAAPGKGRGQVFRVQPNTHLLAPRALAPGLICDLPPGQHLLACAVHAGAAEDKPAAPSTLRPRAQRSLSSHPPTG